MPSIDLNRIVILPNRQRQEFNPQKLQELKDSIETLGLQNPPVLREVDGKLVLVSGERRLRAIREIFAFGGSFKHAGQVYENDQVPYTPMELLDDLAAEEAELDENIKRVDLTWQEHAAAVKRLHELRSKQVAAVIAATPASVPAPTPHTIADTAEELTGRRDGSYQDEVRKEILVARHLDDPDVAKAKDAKEAFKILKKKEESKRNQALAQEIGKTFDVSAHKALNINCLTYMRLPATAGQFDVILTDPPYGMGAHEFGDGGGKLTGIEHHYDDSYESWQELMQEWAPLTFAVTKPQAHAYVFCDIDRFHELKLRMEAAGWYVFRTPLIVHKQNSGRVPLPDRGPRRQWEMILYAIKGNKPVTHIYPDVISVPSDEVSYHGAQKPVALYENLLQRSVKPGDAILDSFAGSGTIFPAAHRFKCRAVGLEQSSEYYGLCLKRLQLISSESQLGLELG